MDSPVANRANIDIEWVKNQAGITQFVTNPTAPNRVWCGDISFIRLQGKWCYLAFVVDLYSRRIVGSALSFSANTAFVCRAMRTALETRPRDGRLRFHSDQGIQYKSNQYRKLLWHYGVCKV